MSNQKKLGSLSRRGNCISCALTLMLTLAAFLLPSNAMADEAWVEFDSSNKTLAFKYGEAKPSSNGTVTVYDLNEGSNYPEWNRNNYTSVVFDESFSNARPTTCYQWFYYQQKLTKIEGLQYLNTEKVTDMRFMFESCDALTTIDISSLNTENVENMSGMFINCDALTTVNMSGLNTEKVTDMSGMFDMCKALTTVDMSGLNTANVNDMHDMFAYCSELKNLDLSNFKTANVKDMSGMFDGCTALTTIYVSSNFDITNVANSKYMFDDCENLVGVVAYDKNNVGVSMANYKTGYFKTYYKIGETKTELYGQTLSVENLTLEDGKDFVACAPFTASNVSYSRTRTNNWGTLCLPFDIETTNFTDSKFYFLESVSSNLIMLAELNGLIDAGIPVLVYSTTDLNITASNANVVTSPADGEKASGYQLVGSFIETEVPDDGYIITKDKFWLSSDLKTNTSAKAVKTKGMRAWLKPGSESTETKAPMLGFSFDGTTAIDTVNSLTEGTAEIYDIEGRRTDRLQKGLNIVKTGKVTKKIMVK